MEIMVCLVVMSVVVIGGSGLQLQSSRQARSSAQMAQAALLASELAALLRQRAGMAVASAWPAWVQDMDIALADSVQTNSAPDCRVQACDAEQALQFELGDWSSRALAALPAARLVVCRDQRPWNEAASRLEWACSGEAEAPLLLKLGWRGPQHPAQAASALQLVMAVE